MRDRMKEDWERKEEGEKDEGRKAKKCSPDRFSSREDGVWGQN